jgi:hypothetical protein
MQLFQIQEGVMLFKDPISEGVADKTISFGSVILCPLEDGPGLNLNFFLGQEFFVVVSRDVKKRANGR